MRDSLQYSPIFSTITSSDFYYRVTLPVVISVCTAVSMLSAVLLFLMLRGGEIQAESSHIMPKAKTQQTGWEIPGPTARGHTRLNLDRSNCDGEPKAHSDLTH